MIFVSLFLFSLWGSLFFPDIILFMHNLGVNSHKMPFLTFNSEASLPFDLDAETEV